MLFNCQFCGEPSNYDSAKKVWRVYTLADVEDEEFLICEDCYNLEIAEQESLIQCNCD